MESVPTTALGVVTVVAAGFVYLAGWYANNYIAVFLGTVGLSIGGLLLGDGDTIIGEV